MKRKIVSIDEEKCNGCGLCVSACHEGAIQLINGKARLVSDEYCDGLGACLPECPTGAIEIIEREAAEFDEAAVAKKMAAKQTVQHDHPEERLACGCPGTTAKSIQREAQPANCAVPAPAATAGEVNAPSELSQWPVQIRLINPNASYLENAHLLIAADCTAYAYGNFHHDFIKGKVTLIACPKLDDNEYNIEKLTEILRNNDIKSVTVTRMEVPCCGGIVMAVRQAMLNSGKIVPYREVTISADGRVVLDT